MSRQTAHSLVLAFAVSWSALPLVAQEEPAGRFEERIQITEVLLDVLVTDADGNVVIGLDESDFIVEEEGRPVTVGSATFYGSADLLGPTAMAQRPRPHGASSGDRFFILFFHDLRREAPSLIRQQRKAILQSRRWVESALSEQDWVAVVSYYAKLRVHQDFTRDHGRVLSALDSVARNEDPGATWSAAALLGEEPALTRHLPQGKKLRKQTARLEDGLKVLGDAAAKIKGRKNLVLFSIGFGEIDRFGWRPDSRYYPRTQQALNDANVAIYSIALAGSSSIRDPVIEALGHSLSQLAGDTEGRHYQTFASFAAPLSEIVKDNGGYYLLSYSAEYPAGDSGYREVSVRTTNPALRVRARDGYLFGG